MRMYEIISGQKNNMQFEIKDIRSMFKIENKYPRLYDLCKLIDRTKEELKCVCPYYFEYELLPRSAKIKTHIQIIPKKTIINSLINHLLMY